MGQTPAFYQVPEESSCGEQGGYSNSRQKIKGGYIPDIRPPVAQDDRYAPIYDQIEQSRE
jgi:hypothetical protein